MRDSAGLEPSRTQAGPCLWRGRPRGARLASCRGMPREGRGPCGEVIKSRAEPQGAAAGRVFLGLPCPAPVQPWRGGLSHSSVGLSVRGMSGVWGAGGPQCQAALAVLASLCRARPPPLGLDVETCRSFELQPPEQSPSAANSGTRSPRVSSIPGFSA